MSWLDGLMLTLLSAVAGAINAVAGGGSFLVFPALVATGISPVVANATTTLAMWPGSVAAVVGYRAELASQKERVQHLAIPSVLGGILGAWLLLSTSETSFTRLLPWLMLLAASMFTWGKWLGRLLKPRRSAAASQMSRASAALLWLFQLVLASYGGYFGGGMGVVLLSVLALSGMQKIHEMNALKTVLAALINATALGLFIWDGKVDWHYGLCMGFGATCGGYGGSRLARALPTSWTRGVVLGMAWGVTAYFFYREW